MNIKTEPKLNAKENYENYDVIVDIDCLRNLKNGWKIK